MSPVVSLKESIVKIPSPVSIWLSARPVGLLEAVKLAMSWRVSARPPMIIWSISIVEAKLIWPVVVSLVSDAELSPLS